MAMAAGIVVETPHSGGGEWFWRNDQDTVILEEWTHNSRKVETSIVVCYLITPDRYAVPLDDP